MDARSLALALVLVVGPFAPIEARAQERDASAETSLRLEAELSRLGELSDVSAALHGTSGALLGLLALSIELTFAGSWDWLWLAGGLATASIAFGISAASVSGYASGRLLSFDRRHPGYRSEARIRTEETARHARNCAIAAGIFTGLAGIALGLGLGLPSPPYGSATPYLLSGSAIALGTLAGVLGAIAIGLTIDLGARRPAAAALTRISATPLDGGAVALVGGTL